MNSAMDSKVTLETGENIVEIASPQKKFSTLSLVLTLFSLLFCLTVVSFLAGFIFGKIVSNQPESDSVRKPAVITPQKNGNSLLSDPNDNYQIVFPSTWKAASKTLGSGGLVLETEQGSVELWLVIDQPLALSSEQKKGLEKTNQIDLTINKQKVKATEYVYKSGGFLTTAVLSATDKNPKVSFLLKTFDKQTYEVEKTILQSFRFTFTK